MLTFIIQTITKGNIHIYFSMNISHFLLKVCKGNILLCSFLKESKLEKRVRKPN